MLLRFYKGCFHGNTDVLKRPQQRILRFVVGNQVCPPMALISQNRHAQMILVKCSYFLTFFSLYTCIHMHVCSFKIFPKNEFCRSVLSVKKPKRFLFLCQKCTSFFLCCRQKRNFVLQIFIQILRKFLVSFQNTF